MSSSRARLSRLWRRCAVRGLAFGNLPIRYAVMTAKEGATNSKSFGPFPFYLLDTLRHDTTTPHITSHRLTTVTHFALSLLV